jgi:hypothetical protein
MMAITAAEKVLITGGVLNLAYGVLLGYPITVIRAKGAPAAPKYLMAAHVGALLHAAVLLGLVWAVRAAPRLAGCGGLAGRRLLRADRREGHAELAHRGEGRIRRKSQVRRPAGSTGRGGDDRWCRHLRRRRPRSAVTPVASRLGSLARRHDRASPAAPITPICAWDRSLLSRCSRHA